ncbi:TRAP transporter small permease [Virgibacillus ainsalahensis]
MEKEKKRPIEAYISFFLFVIMTITMFVEVVARYIFSSSISWTGELTRYLFVWFIFISASYALAEKAHIRVEALNSLLPNKVRPFANLVGAVVWLAFSLFVSYLGVDYALTMFNSTSAAMNVPMGIIYLGIPIGYFLMSLRLIGQIINTIRGDETENEST